LLIADWGLLIGDCPNQQSAILNQQSPSVFPISNQQSSISNLLLSPNQQSAILNQQSPSVFPISNLL
jgi:hypothetical protein